MVDAAYYHPAFKETYFFGGCRFALIQFTPGQWDDKITWGPERIHERWSTLASIGFGTIDAILPVEGSPHEFYVFRGSRLVRIKLAPNEEDKIVGGPWVITEKFKTLASAGFDTIDAAMPVPARPGEAYIFRGTKYIRINVDQDRTVFGPAKLTVEWPALTAAGFDSVDAALPVPEDSDGLTYFFSGDQFARIKVIASAPDEPSFGPKPIKPQLEPDYENFSTEEKADADELYRRRLLSYYYHILTGGLNKAHLQALRDPLPLPLRYLVDTAGRQWTGDLITLKGTLIRMIKHWPHLPDTKGIPCPIQFTDEEMDGFPEQEQQWLELNHVVNYWREQVGGVTEDGWISNEKSEKPVRKIAELKESLIAMAEGDEEDIHLLHKGWFFRDRE